MAPPLLLLQDTRLTFGGTPLLEGAELSVSAGERVGLVGRNGSGKSTLLKIAAGLVQADSGARFVQPGATVRYLPQEPDLSGFETTLAYVEAGMGPGDQEYRALYLLNELGLTGNEHPANLSGGEARRAALARVLAPEPDILLLDEPTNHLDLPAIEWLESEIASSRSALVLISHDRRFLEDLTRATVWLDRGRTRRMERGFKFFEEWRDQVLEEEERDQQKLARQIVAEEHWMRYGVTARRKRNMRRVGQLAELRKQFREHRHALGTVSLTSTQAEVSGKLVMEAENISKSYGDRVIVRDLSIRIQRGDRIGIVGPNGAGKTTMLKMLTGELEPDSGTAKLGTNIEMATLDQRRAALDPERSVRDTLTDGRGDQVFIGGNPRHVIGYMKDFLFMPEQARTPVSSLSGGERGRLLLACALAQASNLMVLDEPTNDLDLETLDLLEEMIDDYAGTVLLVSHDRDFLDRTVTATIAYEGDGNWTVYAGGYSDMVAQRGHGVKAKAVAATAKPAASPSAKAATAPVASKRKLSNKEKYALDQLPKQMAQLEADITRLNNRLATPNFYTKDPSGFQKATAELTRVQAELAKAEEQWLQLEMLREELGG
ncbi:ABC-F family ATP-binding cassette domain-containing protein [Ancylobacter sp. G4_0304]|uniref:ABC-F family ATP-binding cassette domain-containing protein n=1 Tax=Ancylobacter sp. G4_0304 TaxID=3114289 RepID=UPI0039C5BB64